VLPIFEHITKTSLPDGYAYKGGAARALLLRNTLVDVSATARDLDVVRISEWNKKSELDEEVTNEFMPDDAAHGHGVEIIDDLDKYFNTRDFTMNEVLATESEIYVTKQGLLDCLRRIIRVTDYERDAFGGQVGPKLLAKSVRMHVEMLDAHPSSKLILEDYEIEKSFIPPFWLALQLDRALENGAKHAQRYVSELVKRKIMPEWVMGVDDAIYYLTDQMEENPFYFRYAPESQFRMEEDWVEKQFEKMPKRSGVSRGDA